MTLVAVVVAVAGAGAAAATTAPARAAVARTPTAPPRITTLGQLNRWMGAAVRTEGSASFTHDIVIGSITSDHNAGVFRWVKGQPSVAFTKVNQPYFGTARYVVLPRRAYRWGPVRTGQPMVSPWTEIFRDDRELTGLERQLNPALMYPKLGELKVTRSRVTVRAEGIRCWVYTVVMTATQEYGSQPAELRPSPEVMKGGTATVSFTVDAAGRPHRVVVVYSWPGQGSYREISTFSRWGGPVTVRAPAV